MNRLTDDTEAPDNFSSVSEAAVVEANSEENSINSALETLPEHSWFQRCVHYLDNLEQWNCEIVNNRASKKEFLTWTLNMVKRLSVNKRTKMLNAMSDDESLYDELIREKHTDRLYQTALSSKSCSPNRRSKRQRNWDTVYINYNRPTHANLEVNTMQELIKCQRDQIVRILDRILSMGICDKICSHLFDKVLKYLEDFENNSANFKDDDCVQSSLKLQSTLNKDTQTSKVAFKDENRSSSGRNLKNNNNRTNIKKDGSTISNGKKSSRSSSKNRKSKNEDPTENIKKSEKSNAVNSNRTAVDAENIEDFEEVIPLKKTNSTRNVQRQSKNLNSENKKENTKRRHTVSNIKNIETPKNSVRNDTVSPDDAEKPRRKRKRELETPLNKENLIDSHNASAPRRSSERIRTQVPKERWSIYGTYITAMIKDTKKNRKLYSDLFNSSPRNRKANKSTSDIPKSVDTSESTLATTLSTTGPSSKKRRLFTFEYWMKNMVEKLK